MSRTRPTRLFQIALGREVEAPAIPAQGLSAESRTLQFSRVGGALPERRCRPRVIFRGFQVMIEATQRFSRRVENDLQPRPGCPADVVDLERGEHGQSVCPGLRALAQGLPSGLRRSEPQTHRCRNDRPVHWRERFWAGRIAEPAGFRSGRFEWAALVVLLRPGAGASRAPPDAGGVKRDLSRVSKRWKRCL